ncbi:MAG: L,D-transpeptidase [Desulfarculaceae bacterium]|nr:L,D-transpeptidase [Desulfarculaceae bacterium]MCF8073495.1 L,D-transpeptidase [Desulfarculaceae bacterium]MCF8100358.1 L,D-transpeptidase [Desulfarculaceae bacterium]MCF8118232.1 L,D-transpeptidase [Desulfarculaceae bacterium]
MGAAWAASAPSLTPLDGQGTPVVWCYHGQAPDTRLVVVDKSRQRLLVLRYLGKLGLEYEYPCASGEKNGPKIASKDEKTPEGIYFITHRYKDRKVTIFGDRALHLNYPNPQDRAQGRKGDGIYIHGTNRDYKPRSSNGCLVMNNKDLARVEPLLDEQFTPVIVVERMALPSPALQGEACEFLRTVNLDALGAGGKSPQSLELLDNGKGKAELKALAGDLERLGPGLEVRTRGLALFGAQGQWVLLANQHLKGPKGKGVAVTRRYYLTGPSPAQLKPVQVQWVVPDLPKARLLASWAPAKPVAVVAKAPVQDPQAQIKTMLNAWLKAWQGKRLKRYMSYYARDFRSSGKNWRQWRRHKAYLNRVYKKITVRVEDIQIKVHGSRATVSFVQHYRSDWHRDLGLKTLQLVQSKGRWLIRSEQWKKLPAPGGAPKRG